MPKATVSTKKPEPEPQAMQDAVQPHREREYDGFLHRKVEDGRASMRDGRGRSNEEVEAAFAARRARVARQA